MKSRKILVTATVAFLLVTAAAVLAHGTERIQDDVNDWWEEMTEHHEEMHGDDFEAHHEDMHGEDWEEHVESCHGDTDYEDMHRGEHMDTTSGTMMSGWL